MATIEADPVRVEAAHSAATDGEVRGPAQLYKFVMVTPKQVLRSEDHVG
jgi:hypothetical protein